MSNNEKIIDRILKLSRLSESNNQHEAALAAEMMVKLMQEHQITEATLQAKENSVIANTIAEPVLRANILHNPNAKNLTQWMTTIAMGICKSMGCILYTQGSRMLVIGRKSDADACNYMFMAIVNQVKAVCNTVWHREGQHSGLHGKSWKNSFYLGCSRAIYDRLLARKSEMMKLLEAEKSTALVVFDSREREVEGHAIKIGLRTVKKVASPNRSMAAYESGRVVGSSMNLETGRNTESKRLK